LVRYLARAGEIRARATALIAGQSIAEPRLREREHLQHALALATTTLLLLALLPLLEHDAGLVGQLLQNVEEGLPRLSLEEAEHVALGVTAEALEVALVGVNVERRRLLAVNRTQPDVAPP